MTFQFRPYEKDDRADVLALSMRAWTPVFEKLEPAVPDYVYKAFYPKGWRVRQEVDVARFLDEECEDVLVAVRGAEILGFVGLRFHQDDNMGEIYILAVDPAHQRRGIAKALVEKAVSHIRAAGMGMVMVETGGDPGHAASRATYESFGFERWPVARYFRKV